MRTYNCYNIETIEDGTKPLVIRNLPEPIHELFCKHHIKEKYNNRITFSMRALYKCCEIYTYALGGGEVKATLDMNSSWNPVVYVILDEKEMKNFQEAMKS